MGGGAAFFDYDNDGWLDIFLVNGTSFDPDGPRRGPTSYLFHNNRDGTFTDVTKKAGLTHSGWGQGCCVGDYDNDGFDDLFVTFWGRNVLYHNNGDGTFTDVTEKAGVAGIRQPLGRRMLFSRLRPRRPPRSVRRKLRELRSGKAPLPGDSALLPLQRDSGAVRAAGLRRRHQHPLSQSRRRHLRGRLGSVGIANPRGPSSMVFVTQRLAAGRVVRDGRGRGGLRQRRLARYLRRLATPRRACSIATTTTAPSARLPCRRAARLTSMASPWRAWASVLATTTATAGSTSSAPTSPSR